MGRMWYAGSQCCTKCHGVKGYARAIRIHKLTLQVLWQLLLPRPHAYLEGFDLALRAELLDLRTVIDADHFAHMVEKLTSDRFQQAMKEFAEEKMLQHELMAVPLSLATTSGSLHSTNKFAMASILTQQVEVPANITQLLSLVVCSLMDKHLWWHLEDRCDLWQVSTGIN